MKRKIYQTTRAFVGTTCAVLCGLIPSYLFLYGDMTRNELLILLLICAWKFFDILVAETKEEKGGEPCPAKNSP